MATKPEETPTQLETLAKLRVPFADHHISKLPKESKRQTEQRKADQDKGNWPAICKVCGGQHHPNAVHLDYVGHAALTDRLLDVDPLWNWEPMAFTAEGAPLFTNSGLWIRLTVGGMTRIGYGNAEGKQGGDAIKEIIGDALRNAGIRFGMALDLWHKGTLHVAEAEAAEAEADAKASAATDMAINLLKGAADAAWFKEAWEKNYVGWKTVLSEENYKRVLLVKNEMVAKFVKEAAEAKAAEEARERENIKHETASQPADMTAPFDDEISF